MPDDKMQTNENELPDQARPEQENQQAQQSQYEDLAMRDYPAASGRRPLFGS